MLSKPTSSDTTTSPVIIIVPSNSNEKIYKKRVDKAIEIFDQNITFLKNTELGIDRINTYILCSGL